MPHLDNKEYKDLVRYHKPLDPRFSMGITSAAKYSTLGRDTRNITDHIRVNSYSTLKSVKELLKMYEHVDRENIRLYLSGVGNGRNIELTHGLMAYTSVMRGNALYDIYNSLHPHQKAPRKYKITRDDLNKMAIYNIAALSVNNEFGEPMEELNSYFTLSVGGVSTRRAPIGIKTGRFCNLCSTSTYFLASVEELSIRIMRTVVDNEKYRKYDSRLFKRDMIRSVIRGNLIRTAESHCIKCLRMEDMQLGVTAALDISRYMKNILNSHPAKG